LVLKQSVTLFFLRIIMPRCAGEHLSIMSSDKKAFDVVDIPEFTNEEDCRQSFKNFCTAKVT
jgi:hypothetical protein